MKNLIRALGLSLITASMSFAIPYTSVNIEQLLRNNQHGTNIKLTYLQNRVLMLSRYAGQYPPTFSSKEDQDQAALEAKLLLQLVKKINKSNRSEKTLYLSMQVARIAYNLDVENSTPKLLAYSAQFIRQSPEHPAGYLFLGTLLVESGNIKEGRAYLLKAQSLGDYQAGIALQMLELLEEPAHASSTITVQHIADYQPSMTSIDLGLDIDEDQEEV